MKTNPNIKSAYNRWADTYDSVENKTRDLDEKVIRELITDLKNKTIVEVGCGTGKNTAWLSKNAGRVAALDLSEEMMKIAAQKVSKDNVLFMLQDITSVWHIENSYADIVTTNLVLEHIEDINFIFSEAFRVLKPGGVFFVSELHPEKQLLGKKAKFVDKEKLLVEIDSYYHSKEDFQSAAEKAGFKDVTLKDWFDDENPGIPRLLSCVSIKELRKLRVG